MLDRTPRSRVVRFNKGMSEVVARGAAATPLE